MPSNRPSCSCARHETQPLPAERGGENLSSLWITSIFYKQRQIERPSSRRAQQRQRLPKEHCVLSPYAETPSEERQGRHPGGHRPAHEHSVCSPRRAIIIVDLAATRAIFPVPTIARVLRRTLELLLSNVGAVPPQAGVIVEGGPGDRIVVAADAEEAAKAEHSIGHLAAALVDHDALDGTNMLAMGVIDIRAFYFIATDETNGLSRFCCHTMTPLYVNCDCIASHPQDMN